MNASGWNALARYASRVVLPVGAVELLEGQRVRVETAPDPRTGQAVLEMDRLGMVHALCQQIPDLGLHLVRYYGAYANRTRRRLAAARDALAGDGAKVPEAPPGELLPREVSFEDVPSRAPPGSAEALRRQVWARMIRRCSRWTRWCVRAAASRWRSWPASPPPPSSTPSSGTAANEGWSRPSRRARLRQRSGRGACGPHQVLVATLRRAPASPVGRCLGPLRAACGLGPVPGGYGAHR